MPSNYPETLEFLIKNIIHEVKDNKWTTSIESFCTSIPGTVSPQTTTLTPPPTTPPVTTPPVITPPVTTPPVTSSPKPPGMPHTDDPSLSRLRNAIVKYAKSFVGQRENAANNNTGFEDPAFQQTLKTNGGYWSSTGSEWCSIFANSMWNLAYTEVSSGTDTYSSQVRDIYNNIFGGSVKSKFKPWFWKSLTYARQKGYAYDVYNDGPITVDLLTPGDLILIDHNPAPSGRENLDGLGHITMVVKVDVPNNKFWTIGGNETTASGRGGVVYRQRTITSNMVAFIKVPDA